MLVGGLGSSYTSRIWSHFYTDNLCQISSHKQEVGDIRLDNVLWTWLGLVHWDKSRFWRR